MKLNALAAHRRGMTDTIAPAAVVEPPVTTSVPVTPDPSLMAAAPAPAAPARPDGLPDAYWDETAGTIKPEAYSRLAELEAAQAAAGEGVPEAADKYVLELPEPVVGLDGKPVAFDADDPLVKSILPAFHEAKVPQAAVSKILQAYAATELAAAKAEADAATAYVAAEHAKLGAGHKERTAALHGQVIAAIGEGPAEALRSNMRTADGVIALEQLLSKLQAPAMSAVPAKTPAVPDLSTRLYGS